MRHSQLEMGHSKAEMQYRRLQMRRSKFVMAGIEAGVQDLRLTFSFASWSFVNR